MKRCGMCKTEKPADQFHRRAASKDGLSARCKECVRKASAEWRAKNAERKSELGRQWYARNREAVKEKARKWRRDNPERFKATVEAWHARHPESRHISAKEWRKRNPDKVREIGRNQGRRRTVDRNDESCAYAVIIRGDPCSYCGEPVTQIDHIVPIAAGGTSAWNNLTGACHRCNGRKRDQPLLTFLLAEADESYAQTEIHGRAA